MPYNPIQTIRIQARLDGRAGVAGAAGSPGVGVQRCARDHPASPRRRVVLPSWHGRRDRHGGQPGSPRSAVGGGAGGRTAGLHAAAHHGVLRSPRYACLLAHCCLFARLCFFVWRSLVCLFACLFSCLLVFVCPSVRQAAATRRSASSSRTPSCATTSTSTRPAAFMRTLP